MSVKLIVRWDDEDKQPQEMERIFDSKIICIGRNIRNDFCISDRFASSYNTKIEYKDNAYILHDLGSTNGTYLNGEKIQPNKQKILKNGDIIRIARFDIEFAAGKKTGKDTKSASPAMCKAAYDSLYEMAKYFIPDDCSFKSEEDIKMFCERLQGVVAKLCAELFTNIEIYSQLQYELDVNNSDTTRRKYNPIKTSVSAKDTAKYLLNWKIGDKLSTLGFLKKACNDLSSSQKTILKILESVLPVLLEKIGPEAIQYELCKHNQNQSKPMLEKLFKQSYKNLWCEYVERHREYKENKNKRFEIISEEFQKTFQDVQEKDT